MVCPAGWLQSIIWISVMTTGLQCEQYGVSHIISRMCAVQQSTVLIPCKYTHPKHERVSAMSWLYEKSPEEKVRVLSTDPVFKGRVEFVESSEAGRGNCSLLLKDVRKDDEGIFHFVFRMENSEKNWTNIHGIHLEITDAEVEIQPDVVMEGDGILLTCGSCIPSIILPTYIWMKEGRLLSQHHGNNILYLDPVKLEDGGQYSCTISGHERLTSSTVNISVIPGYPPENVSVSISGSGETVLGDSVTLTCSSDSNPPVLNYTWFKENESSAVGSGQSYSALQSGFFYCVAQNQHGSQRSAAVSVTVRYRFGWHVVLGITVGCGGLLIIIIIIIIILFKMKKRAGVKNENLSVNQDRIYSDVIERVSVHDAPLSESETADHNDAQYSSITPKRLRGNLTAGKTLESTAEIEYATVQHHKNKKMKRTEEHESQNDRRSDMLTVEEASVIYSSVR